MTAGDEDAGAAPAAPVDAATALDLLVDTLAYAREREYTGWDYGDGASSRLLRALPVDSAYLTLAVQEVAKRAPVNLRPLLLVERRRNFKGTALFAMANMAAADLTGHPQFDHAARSLVAWLREHAVAGRAGFCGCHRHDLQTLDGLVPAGTPGIVGTAYGVAALLAAGERYDPDHADVARTAADFLFEDLGYVEDGAGARIDYKPTESGDYTTINAVALGARMLLDIHERFPTPRYRGAATKLLTYVADRQTPLGGWYYRDPPSASHLSMDSHHNGFVVEAYQRYDAVVGDGRFDDVLASALDFYRNRLFEPDGAPNFDETSPYPRDVHAAAQGTIVFTRAGETDVAGRILAWTLENLHAGDGRFYLRKHRYYVQRHVLMRWCEAWMAHALGAYATAVADDAADLGVAAGSRQGAR